MDSEVSGKHVGEVIKNNFTLCLRMCEIIFFSYLRPRHVVLSEENFVDSNLCVTQCGNFLKGTCHFPYAALAKGTFPHVRP